MGTINRDLVRPCPAPPVGRPRNFIQTAEVQSKSVPKSLESKWRVATDRAKGQCAFNIVPISFAFWGSSSPSRKKEDTGGFLQPASGILMDFEAVSVSPQVSQLVACGKRATWPMSAAFLLQYEDAGGATVSFRLPAFRPGPSSNPYLFSGFPSG